MGTFVSHQRSSGIPSFTYHEGLHKLQVTEYKKNCRAVRIRPKRSSSIKLAGKDALLVGQGNINGRKQCPVPERDMRPVSEVP